MREPFLLDPTNVTLPSRTPWGGRRIARVLKAGLLDPDLVVGESWELSFGPELPSRLEGGRTLADVVRQAPGPMLGREVGRGGTALLVKILDAREPLSVQVHPCDGDPALGPDESGKPESWYVEHAEPGAGIWIGLAEHASAQSIEATIAAGGDLSSQLAFVPVAPGDFFVVDAGTPHAVGGGVTLVEPQRVLPGRRGVTYRFWDWNRRGPDGRPRPLQVERALAATNWERPRGAALLAQIRRRAGPPDLDGALVCEPLAGEGGLAFDALEVARLAGTGEGTIGPADALRALTVLDGEIALGERLVGRGRTAVIPAACPALAVRARRVHAIVASAR